MCDKAIIKLLNALIIFSFALPACEKEQVSSVFNPDEAGNPSPVITSVDPADFGIVSFSEIKIGGDNFSASMDSSEGNTVYIGPEKAEILSASNTELTVLAPPTPGDSLIIKVIVPGAFKIGEYFPFKLKNVQEGVDKKPSVDKVYVIAVDADENVYGFFKTGSSGTINMFSSDGSITEIGNAPFPLATDMKAGPDGYLYMLYSYQYLYRMKISDGVIERYMTLPERVSYFDFDQNHNIYTGGRKKGIIVTDVNGTAGRIVGDFEDFDIYSVRVFDGDVYIAARYSGIDTSLPAEGIFKAKITSADGDLGETAAVYDWDDAGDHSGSAMKSITFDENGIMLVGTSNLDNPILKINNDGSIEKLYPDLLFPTVGQIVYGNGEYVYQNRTISDMETHTIYKILTPYNSAPYYGRE